MKDSTNATSKKVRHFEMPKTLGGKLFVWRFVIARRFVQILTLLLFFGTAHWGWSLFQRPLLSGNLSSSLVLGALPLSDTFAVVQILASRHLPMIEALIGAVIVLLLYVVLGGRIFCAWICPMNMVTDGANWIREKLGIKSLFIVPSKTRYWLLGLSLIVSFVFGVAAFEWVSP
ncbi:MAG: 4Fe-4S binding protein, partial [Burkholderiales bacterium]|nr:4Fe-4S binding protein [Burkholderiales bacterium]